MVHIHCKREGREGGGGRGAYSLQKRGAGGGEGGRGAYSLQKRGARGGVVHIHCKRGGREGGWCIFTAKSVFWRNTVWKADRNKYLSVGSDRNMTSMEFIARWLLHGWLPATDRKYIEMGDPARIFNFTHEKVLFIVRIFSSAIVIFVLP